MNATAYSTNAAAQLRRAWIERQLHAAGSFNIDTGVEILGCSRAQISADLRALQEEHPDAITYDQRRKTYLWTGKKPRTKLPAFVGTVIVTDEFNNVKEVR